jgi:succinate dehydrogenase / fumarate reductase cytochrome b subunit
VLSILHRIAGVGLVAGTLLLLWWLIAVAAGPGPFATVQVVIGSWFGRLLLFGWTLALFYHLCNGIRFLFWDLGLGFELTTVYVSGWAVVLVSLALTLGAWSWGYAVMGAW